MFRLGPLPLYQVGLDSGAPPARQDFGYADEPPEASPDDQRPPVQFGLVPAQDVASWVEAHPAEHDAFKSAYPLWWKRTSQDLQR
ncbi:MAG: hypothetical protein AB7S38_29665 [Vulcanimicrobiota bacterium]